MPEPIHAHQRVALFDLDGTLIDAVPDILPAINHVMDIQHLAHVTYDEATALMGDGLHQFALRAFQRRGAMPGDEDIATFARRYARHAAVHTRLYPGVATTLQVLADNGWRLVVCSNKSEAVAEDILVQLGIRPYFAVVCGGDTVIARKPDPRHLQEALSRAGGAPDQAVMIGDYQADVWAARTLGVPCVFAAWGYGQKDMGTQATRIAAQFSDLPALLDEVLPLAITHRQPMAAPPMR
ncbi:MAG TPA: HAD-IA family hydrolase [Dyella sp.]|uniref:HAD family hydrolase n=1 Tax=Dyella sp. TaxID=1869338 RepID=UPI002C13A9CC|nr:HAD-IA family hydrolase [Dyella sp.]HTV85444.1 HAD-IA family hydrolase [Dyella sp.]